MHNIVNRINLPNSADVSSLYIQCNEAATINYQEGDQVVVCSNGGIISSNTYFNSFYESFYAKYTNLDSLYYLLKLEGNFQISIYREVYGGNNQELIGRETLKDCQISSDIKVLLPNIQSNNKPQGRVYFELLCLSEKGIFKQGIIATDEQEQTQEISLAIITCTFKKEAYIKQTVKRILQDELLAVKKWKLFVVDNGQSLSADDFPDSRVQLIPNRNVGGSGGFTRGLVAALQENTASHFLFMDDDIELDSESIYRLFALYKYAKSDFAVAGSMLDLHKKHVLYEAGAIYGQAANRNGFQPFSITRLKHDTDLQKSTNLNFLLLEENIGYGAFWFFTVSKKVVEQIGLLLPLFIKLDDIEFCTRIKKALGGEIVAFPSIAVWHEPFYLKFPVWDHYYYHRNSLITHAIHKPIGYVKVITKFTKPLIYNLLTFDYNYAEMRVKAFEDYVKGPDFLKKNDPEVLHSSILALSKSYKTQNVQQNYLPPNNQTYSKTKSGKLKKIVSLLTLNGHLLPNFILTEEDAFILHSPNYYDPVSKALAKKRVLIYKEGSNCLFQNEIDKLAGIKLLFRWFKVVANSSIKWSFVSLKWKNASNELTSNQFWQRYLGLKE